MTDLQRRLDVLGDGRAALAKVADAPLFEAAPGTLAPGGGG
jgi:hypothetical protein